ncbi:hypothetical protein Aperf_G00000108047 [Anoplocephala perfoliata]
MTFSTERLPTGPTEDDFSKRNDFRRHLKIISPIFLFITAVLLAVGIYIAADPGRRIYGLGIFGYILIALGIISLIVTVITGDLFFRLAHSVSQTTTYVPKSADRLLSRPYPRQPNGSVRRRYVPIIHTEEETLHQPMINQPDSRADISSSVLSDDEHVILPMPVPSAPSEEVVALEAGNRRLLQQSDDDAANMKGSLPMPQMPPPFPPPYPTGDPPPYDEVTKT